MAGEAARLWGEVDPGRIGPSWLRMLPRLLLVLIGAQTAAAGQADRYLEAVLDAQGIDPAGVGSVVPSALAGVASDGRDLSDLLYQPAIRALSGIKGGASVEQALAGGGAGLDMIVRTQVADAGRVADQVATVARRQATGYVRMLVGGGCDRCAILAGRRYGWSAGFQRHPRLPVATACTFRRVRTLRTTLGRTRSSTSLACLRLSRTACSRGQAPRRSGRARTSPRW
ncbi:hypothetical protein [Micromonospora aurantiaca]|uniref:hypothetical protein n=1 Tax=Micromonospora aurantiaca (nom. illeg.) TaxID=47850 RepID=UPI0013C35314|nr:hypothetical protein [Micromonospora aurantiaca]